MPALQSRQKEERPCPWRPSTCSRRRRTVGRGTGPPAFVNCRVMAASSGSSSGVPPERMQVGERPASSSGWACPATLRFRWVGRRRVLDTHGLPGPLLRAVPSWQGVVAGIAPGTDRVWDLTAKLARSRPGHARPSRGKSAMSSPVCSWTATATSGSVSAACRVPAGTVETGLRIARPCG